MCTHYMPGLSFQVPSAKTQPIFFPFCQENPNWTDMLFTPHKQILIHFPRETNHVTEHCCLTSDRLCSLTNQVYYIPSQNIKIPKPKHLFLGLVFFKDFLHSFEKDTKTEHTHGERQRKQQTPHWEPHEAQSRDLEIMTTIWVTQAPCS